MVRDCDDDGVDIVGACTSTVVVPFVCVVCLFLFASSLGVSLCAR